MSRGRRNSGSDGFIVALLPLIIVFGPLILLLNFLLKIYQ